MRGETDAYSSDCSKVKGTTVAVGHGEKANIDVKTVVRSEDKDIDVTVYVKKVQKGEDVKKVAVG